MGYNIYLVRAVPRVFLGTLFLKWSFLLSDAIVSLWMKRFRVIKAPDPLKRILRIEIPTINYTITELTSFAK